MRADTNADLLCWHAMRLVYLSALTIMRSFYHVCDV
jgi:hypothetical protein